MRRLTAGSLVLCAAAAVFVHAQPPQFTNAVRASRGGRSPRPGWEERHPRARDGARAPFAELDQDGDAFRTLVKKLVDRNVALTSTLPVFETFTPGRPLPPGLEVLVPQLKEQFQQAHAKTAQNQQSNYIKLFPKGMALERAFAKAGGLLIAGTDPTGGGGVVPGYSNQRQLELLVEAGFSPVEAISIGTLNGAKYLGRDARIGTIAAGKQADLVVVAGDPSKNIADIRNVETVFRLGVGYDPQKLIQAVTGRVGLW